MPASSKAQFRLMQGIAQGNIAPKGKLTPAKAKEYVSAQDYAGLPEKKSKKTAGHKAKAPKGFY